MTTLSKKMKVTMAGISLVLVMTPGCTTGTAVMRPTSSPDAIVTPSRSAIRNDAIYADGVYTATGQYGSGPSSITVTVTLEDDVITAVDVTPQATNPTSLDYQRRFADAVPAVVVGRPIDEVNVGRLAGSSGTPDGFNAAIQRIKEQARRVGTTTQ
ncbi:MAG TPA: hypothetical protein VFU22_25600 [Roseiflexaceae bacterium]|nr:hypothetical protein [Roseiflexaceae bacterium]